MKGKLFILLLCAAALANNNNALQITKRETSTDDNKEVCDNKAIGPWSEILEEWIMSNGSPRGSREIKLGDSTLRITNPNKVHPSQNGNKQVSETDLYLLGSMEKLVYKMDFLEKRVKRTEELLYYVISGNNKAKQPCAKNFTRVGQFCYHMSNREYDWKSSASLCRAMGGNLVEFESIEENQDVVAMLQSDKKIRKSYWTGGLNPGLLWIWAASARPVHHDTKQNVIGDGRCLKLEYEPSSRTYMYRGEDCSQKHRFICELSNDDESVNKIERIAKDILVDS
ncbi:hypothetical protein TKK_0005090 [Trichogramma kaykai]